MTTPVLIFAVVLLSLGTLGVLRAGAVSLLSAVSGVCVVAMTYEQVIGRPIPTLAIATGSVGATGLIMRATRASVLLPSRRGLWRLGVALVAATLGGLLYVTASERWMGLASPEDNEAWMSRMNGRRDGRFLTAPFSSEGIGPLTRALLDIAALGARDPSAIIDRLVLLWIIVIVGGAVLSARLILRRSTMTRQSPQVMGFALLAAVGGAWGMLQLARFGHLSFAIAVLAMLSQADVLSCHDEEPHSNVGRVSTALGAAAIGLAYVPFYPLCLALALLGDVRFARRLTGSRILTSVRGRLVSLTLIGVLGVIGVREFASRYAGTLDTGGSSASASLPLIVVVASSFLLTSRVLEVDSSWKKGPVLVQWTGLIGGIAIAIAPVSRERAAWLGTMIIVGLLVGSIGNMESRPSSQWGVHRPGWSRTTLFVVPVIAFAVIIFCVSVYSGDIRGPMYAANKSIFGVTVLLLPLGLSRISRIEQSEKWSVPAVRVLVLSLGLAAVGGVFHGGDRLVELRPQWWMPTIIADMNPTSDTFIACTEPEPGLSYHETYTCNRHLQAFGTDQDLSWYFRYFAWNGTVSTDQLSEVVLQRLQGQRLVLVVRGIASDALIRMTSAWIRSGVRVEVIET